MTNESKLTPRKKKIQGKNRQIDKLTKDYLHSDKSFEELFPNLAKEMDIDVSKVTITGVRSNTKKIQNSRDLSELKNPDIISFIRRCNNNEEAHEIINYMLGRGEITTAYAEKLKVQLEIEGLRSFGTHKKPGYYEKKYFINSEKD